MKKPTIKERDYWGINGVGIEQLTHEHFEKWYKYLISEYDPPRKEILLIMPCAAIKPYYNSPIHKVINDGVNEYENKIAKIVVSNAGIIPYEFADEYPFESYDWNPAFEEEEDKKNYYQITKKRMKGYLSKHADKYEKIIIYLRPTSESYKATIEATKETGNEEKTTKIAVEERKEKKKDLDLSLIEEKNVQKLLTAIKERFDDTTKRRC